MTGRVSRSDQRTLTQPIFFFFLIITNHCMHHAATSAAFNTTAPPSCLIRICISLSCRLIFVANVMQAASSLQCCVIVAQTWMVLRIIMIKSRWQYPNMKVHKGRARKPQNTQVSSFNLSHWHTHSFQQLQQRRLTANKGES